MRTVIAIYGGPAVGKSTVAKEIATRIGAELRHCGDVVKSRAHELGIDLANVSLDEHRKIDAETHRIASTACEPIIIEGRFLDAVLDDIPHAVLVHLTCGRDERITRHGSRGGTPELLQQEDVWSENFRARCYGMRERKALAVTIATDGLDANRVATEVLREVRRLINDAV